MIALTLWACAPDLAAVHDWDDGPPTPNDVGRPSPPDTSDTGWPGTGLVDTTLAGDGGETMVDATDYEGWVHLDLDRDVAEALAENDRWDLRIQRFTIALNGGASGDAGVDAVFLPGATLAGLDSVPSDAVFHTDEPDADGDAVPEYALANWYLYDPSTHLLTPDPGVWIVRTTGGAAIGLSFTSYYDAAGTSGFVQFTWKPLASPFN